MQIMRITRIFLQYFFVILNSFLISSVSDEVNLRKIKHETTGNKQQNQKFLILHRKHNLIITVDISAVDSLAETAHSTLFITMVTCK